MALAATTIIAIGALALGTAAYVSAEQGRKEAKENFAAQAAQNRLARSEQVASNEQRASEERRQQVREERVRRAKIIQAAENTGTSDSSGEFGAVGGLATQLGANLGSNLGLLAAAGRSSGYSQAAADFGSAAQSNLSSAEANQNLFGLSMSIFNSAGGFSNFSTSAPKAG